MPKCKVVETYKELVPNIIVKTLIKEKNNNVYINKKLRISIEELSVILGVPLRIRPSVNCDGVGWVIERVV